MEQYIKRDNLRNWLTDLALLKDHVDLNNPAAQPFNDAWEVALQNALQAAKEYALSFKK